MQKRRNCADKYFMGVKLCRTGFLLLLSFRLEAGNGFPKPDQRGNASENFSSQGAVLTLHSERGRYHHNEAIPLTLKIMNKGYYPITLYLHRDYLKNFTLVARNPEGRSLAVRDRTFDRRPDEDYLDAFHQRYTATNFHSRAIVLRPGESIERPVTLQDLVDLPEDTDQIRVSAFFYPNPEQSPELFLESENTLPLIIDKKQPYRNDSFSESLPIAAPMEVTPRETVYLALSAEYIRDWSNFFKFISLRDLIADYPDFAREFIASSREEQAQVLENFKRYLMTRSSHRLIKFEVLGNVGEQNDHKAQVKVKAIREIEGFRREFYYIYYLTKSDSFWRITGLVSQVTK